MITVPELNEDSSAEDVVDALLSLVNRRRYGVDYDHTFGSVPEPAFDRAADAILLATEMEAFVHPSDYTVPLACIRTRAIELTELGAELGEVG